MITRVNYKPLSVNDVWKGKRYKTDEYQKYCIVMFYDLLPKQIELPEPPFQIEFTFGFSSKSSDWDNPIKPLQDILAQKYKFNDKLIKRGIVSVVEVKKGGEFFEFEILTKQPIMKWVVFTEEKPQASGDYYWKGKSGYGGKNYYDAELQLFEFEDIIPTNKVDIEYLEWLKEVE